MMKVESCLAQDWFYFSFFHGKDAVGSQSLGFFAAQMTSSPKGPKEEQAALKSVTSASCVSCGELCCGTFKYVVFLGHAQDSAVHKILTVSRLRFHATALLSNFTEAKMCLRALQMLLSGTVFAGCFGDFASPCPFQAVCRLYRLVWNVEIWELKGCWMNSGILPHTSIIVLGKISNEQQEQESMGWWLFTWYFWWWEGEDLQASSFCLWCDILCCWDLLLSLGTLNSSLLLWLWPVCSYRSQNFLSCLLQCWHICINTGSVTNASDKLVYAFCFAYSTCYSLGHLCNLRFLCFPHQILAADLVMECHICLL